MAKNYLCRSFQNRIERFNSYTTSVLKLQKSRNVQSFKRHLNISTKIKDRSSIQQWDCLTWTDLQTCTENIFWGTGLSKSARPASRTLQCRTCQSFTMLSSRCFEKDCKKTYFINTIQNYRKVREKSVLAVATSAVAAKILNINGSKDAHSSFKIPVSCDAEDTYQSTLTKLKSDKSCLWLSWMECWCGSVPISKLWTVHWNISCRTYFSLAKR